MTGYSEGTGDGMRQNLVTGIGQRRQVIGIVVMGGIVQE